MMTNILHERPADAKAYILQTLKQIQKVDNSRDDSLNKNIYAFQEKFLV